MKKDMSKLKYQLNLNLLPEDILTKEFKTKILNGYDRDEVNEFLDIIIKDYKILIEELIKIEQLLTQTPETNVSRYEFERLKQQVENLCNKLDSK